MTRVEQKQNKERLILKDLIDKMFEIAGHNLKFEDVEGRKDNWYQQYTMTEDENKEWMKWGIEHIRKKKRLPKKLVEREMAYLNLYCGLKTRENEN